MNRPKLDSGRYPEVGEPKNAKRKGKYFPRYFEDPVIKNVGKGMMANTKIINTRVPMDFYATFGLKLNNKSEIKCYYYEYLISFQFLSSIIFHEHNVNV